MGLINFKVLRGDDAREYEQSQYPNLPAGETPPIQFRVGEQPPDGGDPQPPADRLRQLADQIDPRNPANPQQLSPEQFQQAKDNLLQAGTAELSQFRGQSARDLIETVTENLVPVGSFRWWTRGSAGGLLLRLFLTAVAGIGMIASYAQKSVSIAQAGLMIALVVAYWIVFIVFVVRVYRCVRADTILDLKTKLVLPLINAALLAAVLVLAYVWFSRG